MLGSSRQPSMVEVAILISEVVLCLRAGKSEHRREAPQRLASRIQMMTRAATGALASALASSCWTTSAFWRNGYRSRRTSCARRERNATRRAQRPSRRAKPTGQVGSKPPRRREKPRRPGIYRGKQSRIATRPCAEPNQPSGPRESSKSVWRRSSRSWLTSWRGPTVISGLGRRAGESLTGAHMRIPPCERK